MLGGNVAIKRCSETPKVCSVGIVHQASSWQLSFIIHWTKFSEADREKENHAQLLQNSLSFLEYFFFLNQVTAHKTCQVL